MSAIEETRPPTSSAQRSRAGASSRAAARSSSASAWSVPASARRRRRPRGTSASTRRFPSSWLEIHADNTILMRTGKVELGQGSASTAYAQITAEELNVPYTAITQVVMGDTDRTPDGGFSAGYMGGGNPNPRKVARLRLPGAAQPGLDAARRAGREPDGEERRRLGRRQEPHATASSSSDQALNLTIPVTGSLQGLFGISVTGNPPTKPIEPSTRWSASRSGCGRSRRSSPARRPTSATSGCRGWCTPASCIRPRIGATLARSARSTRSSSRTRRSS